MGDGLHSGETEYGDQIADLYDELSTTADLDPASAVEFLVARSGVGPVLELGIGTGRIALPLRRRGIDVHGIDASSLMVEELRKKPGGSEIPVMIGSFEQLLTDQSYTLIYAPFNAVFYLTDQEAQLKCFQTVADHLVSDGLFITETFMPISLNGSNRRLTVWHVGNNTVDLGVREYTDVADQQYTLQHVRLSNSGLRLDVERGREVWPGELDLMAMAAGMRRIERYGGWDCAPVTVTSDSQISVYKLA